MEVRSTARGLGLLVGCCLAAAATPALADVVDAELWAGGRAVSGDTHSSKFEEYRDLRPGMFGGGNFLITDPNDVTFLWGDFDNVGYQDQRYSFEAGQWGFLRLFGEYSELPHDFSNDARTLYHQDGSSTLVFPDALQGAIQALNLPPASVSTAEAQAMSALLGPGLEDARRISLDYLLKTAGGGLIFNPREDLEFETDYRWLERKGHRPLGMGFGSPGGNFADFAAPIDEHTNEVTADVRYGRGAWNLEAGYLGSFFDDDLNEVTVDNPLRATDALTAGSAQGRISRAPDNSLNSFHATGTYELPLEFPARIATTFSYGLREQDQDFLPHTINGAITGVPANAALLVLPQNSLDGKVQTYLANVLVTARPLPELDLRARYRYYDYHNDTPVLDFEGHVVNDATFDGEIVRNVPNDYSRQLASVDASYGFSRAFTLRGGPYWDRWSRSQDREVSRLDEYGAKLSADTRPARWTLMRLDYVFGTRNGTAYHPFDHLAATQDPAQVDEEGFAATGQLAQLRKFDEADRIRNEVKLLTQLMPREDLDLSFSGGYAYLDYPNSAYGTKDDERWNLGTEIGYQPLEWLSISAWYSFEHISLSQKSRWRPATTVAGVTVVTDSPENNWWSESTDIYNTFGVNLDFVLVPDKLDLGFSYTFERGDGETKANGAAGCVGTVTSPACAPFGTSPPGTSADGGDAVDYPDIKDRLQVFATTLSYHWNEHLTFQGMYAFQKLSTINFRYDGLNPYMPGANVNGSGFVTDPSNSLDVFLGNRIGDYAAHIFALSVIYKF